MKKVILFLLLFMVTESVTYAQKYQIKGKLSGFKENTSVNLVDEETDTQINRTLLKQGTFTLQGMLKDGPVYLTVVLHEGKHDYSCIIFAGGGNIFVNGSKKDFPYDIKISGPAEQLKFNDYQQALKPINIKSEALMQAYLKVEHDPARSREAGTRYNAVGTEYQALSKKLIEQNKNTYFAAKEYYDYVPLMGTANVKRLYNSFSDPIKQSIYGKRIKDYLTAGAGLKKGDHFYDFEAYDVAGKAHKLSEFTNKYVLLDISSIHCGPCLASVDELRMLTTKYKSKLNIVSLSPDNHTDWLKGIKDARSNWINLTDGKGLRSKTMQRYDAPGIPSFFIISPSGKIMDTWVGYTKVKTGTGDLEKHLTKYLNKS